MVSTLVGENARDTLQTLQDTYPSVKWKQVTADTYGGLGTNGVIFWVYRAPDGLWMAAGAPHARPSAVWDETEEHPTPQEALNELVEMEAAYTDVLRDVGVVPDAPEKESPWVVLWNSWSIFWLVAVVISLSSVTGGFIGWCLYLLLVG